MSAWVYGIATVLIGGGGYLGYLMFEAKIRPVTPPSPPQIPAEDVPLTTFAEELRALDAPAPANYVSGEYPCVGPRHAAAVDEEPEPEPVAEPEPVEVPEAPLVIAAPVWAMPETSIYDTRTPIFDASGQYPVLNLDLSATNAWNSADRASLRAALGMGREEAA